MSKARPYLAITLDALENCGPIGHACGLPVERVSHGMLMLWRHVWRTRNDIVTTGHVMGFFFGVNACEALLIFGHLEATPGGWRVKGAAEWLKVMGAQSESGKSHCGNLKRGNRKPPAPPGSPPAPPPVSAELGQNVPGSPPALSASSQQPAAKAFKDSAGETPAAPKFPKPPKPPDPRHHPLKLRLVQAYGEEMLGAVYDFTSFDAVNVTRLLAKSADDDEIVFRWRDAIRKSLDKFQSPKTKTLGELCRDWNHYPAVKNGHVTREMRL